MNFTPCKASQEQQRSTAEGRSILGDLASLNLKSFGGQDETEEGESIIVDSGGIDMSLGKASCFQAHNILCLPQTSRRVTYILTLLVICVAAFDADTGKAVPSYERLSSKSFKECLQEKVYVS